MNDPQPSDKNANTLILFERDRIVSESLVLQLEGAGWSVEATGNPTVVPKLFTPKAFKVALIDLAAPESEGVALANELGREDPELMIILMCTYRALNESLGEITLEHYDYLLKPVRLDQFVLVMHKGRREFGLVQENRQLKEQVGQLNQRVQDLAAAIATHESETQKATASKFIPGLGLRPGDVAIASYARLTRRSTGVDEPTAETQPDEPAAEEVLKQESESESSGVAEESAMDSGIIVADSDATALPEVEDSNTSTDEESNDEE